MMMTEKNPTRLYERGNALIKVRLSENPRERDPEITVCIDTEAAPLIESVALNYLHVGSDPHDRYGDDHDAAVAAWEAGDDTALQPWFTDRWYEWVYGDDLVVFLKEALQPDQHRWLRLDWSHVSLQALVNNMATPESNPPEFDRRLPHYDYCPGEDEIIAAACDPQDAPSMRTSMFVEWPSGHASVVAEDGSLWVVDPENRWHLLVSHKAAIRKLRLPRPSGEWKVDALFDGVTVRVGPFESRITPEEARKLAAVLLDSSDRARAQRTRDSLGYPLDI